MGCLVLPRYVMMKRRRGGSPLQYRPLEKDEGFGGAESPVMVVVGKEKKVFLVEPSVLEESPFRVLIQTMNKESCIPFRNIRRKKIVFIDHVEAMLFEHMLWLMYNDCSSLFKLNVKEVIDFYSQDS